jgi:hypothetical protein
MDLVRTRYDENERWIVVERGPILVAANLSSSPVRVAVGAGRTNELVMASSKVEVDGDWLSLPPESVAIWKTPR